MTPLEKNIKEMYQQQAAILSPPDSMKLEIDRRISEREEMSYVPRRTGRRMSRKALAVVFAAVFLLSSLTCVAALKIAEGRGYTNVVPDYKNFDILNDVAESYGYSINAVKDFSNGYSFKGMRVSYYQNYDAEGQKVGEAEKILNLEYRNEFRGIQLSLQPDNNIPPAPKSILEEFEVDGITVYVTQYIHLMVPEDYEMREEDMLLQEDGILGTGTDSVTYEPTYKHYVNLQWGKDGVRYHLMRLTQNATDDDLKIFAKEWIEAQN